MIDKDFNNLYDAVLEADVLMEMLEKSKEDADAGRVMSSEEFKDLLAERRKKSEGDPNTVEDRIKAMQYIVEKLKPVEGE